MKTFFSFFPIIMAGWPAQAEEPEIQELTFPELGPTLLELATGEPQVPKLLYQMPDGWSPDKTYPVFVFLPGGTGKGQRAEGLGRARAITGGKSYIAVSMPLYRHTDALNEEALFGDLLIGVDDYPAISRAYAPMLRKFFETVPEARRSGNVMGGFSNGAHTISVLLSCRDDVTLRHFSQFIFADGGIWLSGLPREPMKACRFLGLYGDTADFWTRPVIMRQFRSMKETADALEIDFDLVVMEGIGHQFPADYHEAVHDWLKKGDPEISSRKTEL